MTAPAAPFRRPAVWRFGDDPARVSAAVAAGAVCAVPTESSYGLAVDPLDAEGVAAVFRLKGRSWNRPLPVVGADVRAFERLGIDAGDPALGWAARRWPAPLTVLVGLLRPVPAAAGAPKLAVRVPAHERLRELLAALDRPLTATSANPSGESPYLEPEALSEWLARSAAESLLVDGGVLPGGPPSTLVELRDGRPVVLRQGRYAVD
jgi:L-threonylcarbamoyladenylate synthase